MRVSAAQGLARILKAEGTPWVSTFPVCGVNNALAEEGIPLLMMRDERYAVALADGFSRVTGGQKIGVCSVMGGMNPAGLQMAFGALAQAYEDTTPLLCISDGIPAASSGTANFDMVQGFKAVTKWIGEVNQPQRVPEFMRRAFTLLRSGRRGPVLITVPRNLGEYEEDSHPYTPVQPLRWGPDPDDVKAVVKAVLAARRPLLYVGEGVFYGQATDELLSFAQLAQVPVLTTLLGKSAFPEDHPLSLGVRGDLAIHFLRTCDLVLAIGTNLMPGAFSHTIPDVRHKTIIHCAVDELDINKSYRVDHALIGDARLILQGLIGELIAQTAGGVEKKTDLLEEIRAGKQRQAAAYRPLMESDDKPINPYRVYGDLMKTIDRKNSFVTHDSGNTRDQMSTVYEALIPFGFLGWGNVTTLGFGLALAMAAKLAYPERQCVNVTGDAGIAYMIGNLEALVRYGIGVTTIHINNGCFGGYGPGFWGPGHDPYTAVVSDHTVADMSEAVKALGYYAEHIAEPGEIIPALTRAFDENTRGRPAYLEFLCCEYPVYGAWAA